MKGKVVDDVLRRSLGYCEAGTSSCRGWGQQLHHRRLRSQGGKDTVDNLLHVCAPCHSHIHANRAEALERGWILPRWAA